MVEVFKTNIEDRELAARLRAELQALFPGTRINFDLEDCDRILRIESADCIAAEIERVVWSRGFWCEVLED
jgi:hypothetical protein